jgi:phosphate starvation-inducible PhoH-like protein/PhoH-like ATPase
MRFMDEFDKKAELFFGIKLDEYQKKFRDAILSPKYDLVAVNAKAGTGKTTIAVCASVLLHYYRDYDQIIYVMSPVAEQKQGFLPGSIAEKSAPYFEPLIQALTEANEVPNQVLDTEDNIEGRKRGTAYVRPVTHTFVRGCNIKKSVVIIDEAQNYYMDDLKKTITRCHDSDKVILIGHTGQCDIVQHPERSGFKIYFRALMSDIESGIVTRGLVCELKKNYRGWLSNWADDVQFDNYRFSQ